MNMRRSLSIMLLIALAAVMSVAPALAQQRSKRLILKDGSYQSVTKWDLQGDRVHYYSSERYDWEDIPNELIDWNATNKYNAELDEPDSNVKAVNAEDAKERAEEEARTPEVAPGLRLPDGGGVLLLDQFNGQPQLDELMQSGGEVNKQMGKNMLRAVIIPVPTGSKQTIEIKGPHAKVQSHVKLPTLYANVDQAENAGSGANRDLDMQADRYRIVRAETKGDHRIVANLKISLIGKTKEQENFIPAKAQPMGGGWVKITPTEPLAPGEYAVVEMLGEDQMNLYVWDFGVNPAAPANSTAWKPEAPRNTTTGTTATPVLKRPPQE